MADAPIGIFDSGVGGLTVARAVKDQLPNESIRYVGDLEHSPYGPKKIADVRGYALAVLDDLVAQGVKMLVIACNTASAIFLGPYGECSRSPMYRIDSCGNWSFTARATVSPPTPESKIPIGASVTTSKLR